MFILLAVNVPYFLEFVLNFFICFQSFREKYEGPIASLNKDVSMNGYRIFCEVMITAVIEHTQVSTTVLEIAISNEKHLNILD